MVPPAPGHSERLLVLVPAWNEEGGIGLVLAELAAELPEADVLVVDDGSDDRTVAVAAAAGAAVLRLDGHLGLGPAIANGFGHALAHGYTLCGRVDADGQHPAAELRRVVQSVSSGEADLAIGSRFVRSHQRPPYRMPRWRIAATSGVRVLVRGILGRWIYDPLSGMCVGNRSAIELMARPYAGNLPEAEALIRVDRAGLRIAEVPVTMRERSGGGSKMTGRRLLTTLPTLATLARTYAGLAARRARRSRPVRSPEGEPPLAEPAVRD
jgi:glycosyltransferase involved in cell wall biosynthesis